MVSSLVLALGLVSAGAAGPDLAGYEAAKAGVGHDAEGHVKLALWCEAHGLKAERLKHLAIAVLTDPRHASARGLMGLVDYGGRWQRPDAVSEKVKADEALTASLAEYNARRARTPESADDQYKLALWCEQNGLKAEAEAHLTAVTRLDPGHEAAWKRLGFKRHGARWVTEAQLAAERADAEAQKKADKAWRPRLVHWRGWLGGRDRAKRAEAEAALADVTDPRAVPSVWAVFATAGPESQATAVQVFSQIDAPDASRVLAALAITGTSAEVRRAAAESLTRRDRREFLDILIAALRDPIKYNVRNVGGPGSPGSLFLQGKQANVQRVYAPPAVPQFVMPANASLVYDDNGLPVVVGRVGYRTTEIPSVPSVATPPPSPEFNGMVAALSSGANPQGRRLARLLVSTKNADDNSRRSAPVLAPGTRLRTTTEVDAAIPIGQIMLEAQKSAASAQQQLQNDVESVEAYNTAARRSNVGALAALSAVTGKDLGENQEAWANWWTNEKGYAVKTGEDSRPTVLENVTLDYSPQPQAPLLVEGPALTVAVRHSCFGAGTPVRTLTGLKPVEAVQVGDRVLAQDAASGRLSYQPVVGVYHNAPNATLKVRVGNETVVATGIHRFWKAGQGWVMARDLKPGDRLRTLDGVAEVASVDAETVQPVFNLEVAAGRSFFVGGAGLLVHDNSLVEPVAEPFDAEPDLKAVAARGR